MVRVSRRCLTVSYLECAGNEELFFSRLKAKHNFTNDGFKAIKRNLQKSFLPQLRQKWKTACRVKAVFFKKNVSWLDKDIVIDSKYLSDIPKQGRPSKSFENSSDRSKRRKLANIKQNTDMSLKEIECIFLKQLAAAGKKDEAEAIKEILSKGINSYKKQNLCDVFSKQEALALMVDLKLSRYQYNCLRTKCKEKNAPNFPSYYQISNAKADCYPLNMVITERGASLALQDLLNHTTERIFMIEEVKKCAMESYSRSFTLFSKWGCDGSSGNSNYRQNFTDLTISDDSVFVVSLVPLQIVSTENNVVVWKNPHPSSPNYCRPIFFEFLKESPENTKLITRKYKNEIENLNNTVILCTDKELHICHNLSFTMIDGKVAQVLTETSSAACCTICKVKPSDMNNLSKVMKRAVDESAYQYGLSNLHAQIRFMECILHIAYRLPFRRWSARTKEEKDLLKNTKKRIQNELKEKLGIIVDVPRQGVGSSNDGNTARRFFRDIDVVSDITGVSKDLIQKMSVILQVLVSEHPIDEEKFKKFCYETADLYVYQYSWCYMPSSLHKVLIHGAAIIQSATLPIGQLSEEAAEAKNKYFKIFRKDSSRKCSRTATNEDVLHSLLISSDPYLATLRHKFKQSKHMELDQEAKELLIL